MAAGAVEAVSELMAAQTTQPGLGERVQVCARRSTVTELVSNKSWAHKQQPFSPLPAALGAPPQSLVAWRWSGGRANVIAAPPAGRMRHQQPEVAPRFSTCRQARSDVPGGCACSFPHPAGLTHLCRRNARPPAPATQLAAQLAVLLQQ
jgi:hypothetical protein